MHFVFHPLSVGNFPNFFLLSSNYKRNAILCNCNVMLLIAVCPKNLYLQEKISFCRISRNFIKNSAKCFFGFWEKYFFRNRSGREAVGWMGKMFLRFF